MRVLVLVAAVAVVAAASPLLAQECVLGGYGFARLNPQAEFVFSSGPMPDGSAPSEGADVTSSLETAGVFAQPATSTSSMFTTGAGAQVLFGPHWTFDAGYRF